MSDLWDWISLVLVIAFIWCSWTIFHGGLKVTFNGKSYEIKVEAKNGD